MRIIHHRGTENTEENNIKKTKTRGFSLLTSLPERAFEGFLQDEFSSSVFSVPPWFILITSNPLQIYFLGMNLNVHFCATEIGLAAL